METSAVQFVVLTVAGWMNRRQLLAIGYLLAENRVLREQLGDGRLVLNDNQRARLARWGRALGRKWLREFATVAAPDTILRWYRQLIARKYDGTPRRGPGRPRVREDLEKLVVRIATESPTWGYTRIQGALFNLGLLVGRSTVAAILERNGIEPAPERGKRTQWSTFLRAHWGAVAATDFFTVEVLTFQGLVRYYVLFVIDLKSRRVEIAGIVQQPYDGWMGNVAKGLIDCVDGFLRHARYLIHDGDPLFSKHFRDTLGHGHVKTLKLPPRSPNLNAHAERFVGSIKKECLSKVVLLGERHLRQSVREFVTHYHLERNHQGLANALIDEPAEGRAGHGPIKRRDRLGGTLHYYHRDAA